MKKFLLVLCASMFLAACSVESPLSVSTEKMEKLVSKLETIKRTKWMCGKLVCSIDISQRADDIFVLHVMNDGEMHFKGSVIATNNNHKIRLGWLHHRLYFGKYNNVINDFIKEKK
jgi:hypothetical protein